jgi:dTDP-4-amino-4,6-dideoxygalactose transaminase
MIPLYKPYMPALLPELETILHSGSLAYGLHGRSFEDSLRRYIGSEKIFTVNSFNSAMMVALLTIGIKPDDEVISSPMACLASNQPIVLMGAKVVWADIDPLTGTLDPESVRKKITSRTKAIFHNHFCGFPGHIDAINQVAREYGIPVVDDAIEAFGSEYKGQKIGNTNTDITVFSFQAVRLPTTIDGGALVFKDNALFEKGLLIRDSGIDRVSFRNELGEINENCDIELPGFGATMSEINSYIGCRQMDEIDELLEKQRTNAKRWDERFSNLSTTFHLIGQRVEINPNFWVYGLLVDDKSALMQRLRLEGFYASGVHLPNTFYSVFGKKCELPGVVDFYSKFLALPCGWWI